MYYLFQFSRETPNTIFKWVGNFGFHRNMEGLESRLGDPSLQWTNGTETPQVQSDLLSEESSFWNKILGDTMSVTLGEHVFGTKVPSRVQLLICSLDSSVDTSLHKKRDTCSH